MCGLLYLFVINKNVRGQAVSEGVLHSSVQGHFQFSDEKEKDAKRRKYT